MNGLADAPILDADAARCGQLFATKDRAASVAAILRAVASEPRLALLMALYDGELQVHELLTRTDLGASSASQHLGMLRREDLVRFRREGPSVYYAISSAGVRPLLDFLARTFDLPHFGTTLMQRHKEH